MRRVARHSSVRSSRWVIFAIVLGVLGVAARAEQPAAPNAASEEAWRTSPFHGAINGATGQPIPCLCRFREKMFKLGERVCMQTPNGIVLARCDLMQNNTTWVPTTEHCTIS